MITDRSQRAVSEQVFQELLAVVADISDGALRTADHSDNVATYAVAVAEELGLKGERLRQTRQAAVLHDIGKAVVAEEILGKEGALTDEERIEVERHATAGADMLMRAGFHEVATFVRAHHERFDGGGYPHGLAGEAIPLEARIIFAVDSFDAMTSDRPYRKRRSIAAAVAELRRCAGSQFDPEVVAALAAVLSGTRMTVRSLHSQTG